ncbi:MAG: TIGR03984 family CRISPR-associated protein [Caldilineaceae bacterium]|nr:TIGR03984 family CRISPR-associated protein [Caldilineaceae bacterium]
MSDSKLRIQPVTDFPADPAALRPWLEQQARTYDFTWLLAHSDDGVNWGKFDGGRLIISRDVACEDEKRYVPELDATRLIELRLFGPDAELMLWRTSGGMAGRLLDDRQMDKNVETRWERRLLWGVQTDTDRNLKDGFIVVSEADGLRHVVPWADEETQPGPQDNPVHRLYLTAKHYLDFDEDGQAFVAASRLADICSLNRREESES